jgi:hypothetical protein
MSKNITVQKFESTEAKDYIRNIFDYRIISEFKKVYYPDQQLAYFGLPGEQLLDVLSWREFLGRWTGVQISETPQEEEVYNNMVKNAIVNRLERDFQPIKSNIDHLLTFDSEASRRIKWPYQIINLDYYGGLVNIRTDGSSQRQEALRNLFIKQLNSSFLLFLTLNLRDRDNDELINLVNHEEEELLDLDLIGVSECFSAHREFNHAGELKIYVPIFIGLIAQKHDVQFYPPILYRGTQQMIHFAVVCTPYTKSSGGRQFRTSDRIQLINLPLYLLHTGDDLRELQLPKIIRHSENKTISI